MYFKRSFFICQPDNTIWIHFSYLSNSSLFCITFVSLFRIVLFILSWRLKTTSIVIINGMFWFYHIEFFYKLFKSLLSGLCEKQLIIYYNNFFYIYIYRKEGDHLNFITFFRAHLKSFYIICYKNAILKYFIVT